MGLRDSYTRNLREHTESFSLETSRLGRDLAEDRLLWHNLESRPLIRRNNFYSPRCRLEEFVGRSLPACSCIPIGRKFSVSSLRLESRLEGSGSPSERCQSRTRGLSDSHHTRTCESCNDPHSIWASNTRPYGIRGKGTAKCLRDRSSRSHC